MTRLKQYSTFHSNISTHTSTRDVTGLASTGIHQIYISTHTSTRDVTKENKMLHGFDIFLLTRPHGTWHLFVGNNVYKRNFYSHVHTGRDEEDESIDEQAFISTHTSTRDVTAPVPLECLIIPISTHTSTRDVTWNELWKMGNHERFLLTRPHGTWQVEFCRIERAWNFYSHVHTGRDKRYILGEWALAISTHTSTRDVTRCSATPPVGMVFLLTRPHGTWPKAVWMVMSELPFLLTRPHGTWLRFGNQGLRTLKFLLTRPHGTWPGRENRHDDCNTFLLTRPHGTWRIPLVGCS